MVRRTALRDSPPCLQLTACANQVEFAQLANAFNDQAQTVVMQPLPRDTLAGQPIALLDVFTTDNAAEPPVITSVQATESGG